MSAIDESRGFREFLSINLRMKASDAFRAIPLTEAEKEEENAEELANAKKFPWHTKLGIRRNIRKLNEEFNLW